MIQGQGKIAARCRAIVVRFGVLRVVSPNLLRILPVAPSQFELLDILK
jgi:hypothetical protein